MSLNEVTYSWKDETLMTLWQDLCRGVKRLHPMLSEVSLFYGEMLSGEDMFSHWHKMYIPNEMACNVMKSYESC